MQLFINLFSLLHFNALQDNHYCINLLNLFYLTFLWLHGHSSHSDNVCKACQVFHELAIAYIMVEVMYA